MYEKEMAQIHDGTEYCHVDYGNVYLPHSCDEWEIGGEQEVEALIEDLQALLARMRSPDYVKPVEPEREPYEPKEPTPLTSEEQARIAELIKQNGGGRMGTMLAYLQFHQENSVKNHYNQQSSFLMDFVNKEPSPFVTDPDYLKKKGKND